MKGNDPAGDRKAAEASPTSTWPPWTTWLLAAVVLLLTIRLGAHAARFATDSVQQDLASFRVAGQAVARGLSPYDNHVGATPPLWDGVAVYRHSRFLYPPIMARVFLPLTFASYPVTKIAWMLLSLAALAGTLVLSARAVGMRASVPLGLALAAVTLAYFPVLTLLERGQIDSITLLLLVAALMLSVGGRRSFLAGILLAVATTIKLQGFFLLPFLVARLRWSALAGFAAGAAAVVALSLAVHGPAPIARYVETELPRISRFGDLGPRDSRLDPRALRPLLRGVPAGKTTMEGRVYSVDALSFELNASAVRTPLGRATWNAVRGLGVSIAPGQVSLVFLAMGFALVLAWQLRFGPPTDRVAELSYGSGVLALVLLCSPLTWAMATIWLLPIAVVVLHELREPRTPQRLLSVGLCIAGLLLAGAPDPAVETVTGSLRWKYVGAETLCLFGSLGVWGVRSAASR